ncbi:LysR family transcriptional regulator [Alcaligenes sp. SORT26]|uniref:LysR substrate-binding domain-containing protein n=1 Tax=Alcaligenes sp. SORT26 TaxID=2813780 RepID=UPI001A9FCF03|nr:LysR substrate-binding domain-containing protein [Alcaligenes sp. SORT26]QTB99858.1 LysR family transcriptional regulator [Alcaligenes sp. SORT26]
MNPRHLQETALRYFQEVARCGSISQAASNLHVATSAISRQISGLEENLGMALFERHARGMNLTAAGELLLAHARRSAMDAERTLHDIAALQGLQTGLIRIASSEGLAAQLLPLCIAQFRQKHQGIRFQLDVLPPHRITMLLLSGQIDIGIKFTQTAEKDIKTLFRRDAPVMALAVPGHPVTRTERISLKSLLAHPLALPGPDTTVRQMMDVACSAQNLSLDPVFSSNHMQSLHQFALSGAGVTVSALLSARHLIEQGLLQASFIHERGLLNRQIEVQALAGRRLPSIVHRFLDELLPQLEVDPLALPK